MLTLKKKLVTAFFLAFLSTAVMMSCGKKAATEGSEHPAEEQSTDSQEHPSDSTANEHPTDSTGNN